MRTRWGRTALVVIGALVALAGLGLGLVGTSAMLLDRTRDRDGYVTALARTITTDTYAVTAEGLEIHPGAAPDWLVRRAGLGSLRVSAISIQGELLFVGIAREKDVDAFLAGVAHEEYDRRFRSATEAAGSRPAEVPIARDFWAASAFSTGAPTLTWPVEEGRWTLVVMNAHATPGVEADVTIGVEVRWLDTFGLVLLVGGVVLLVVGAATTWWALGSRPAENALWAGSRY